MYTKYLFWSALIIDKKADFTYNINTDDALGRKRHTVNRMTAKSFY